MIATVNPRESVQLVYTLDDPSDAGVYYIQAVVRNTLSGATITTVNLTAGSSGRFTGSFEAPADTSGRGLWIDVTMTVYTNSGYSVVSDTYRRQNVPYLVQERWNVALRGGGGGSDLTKGDVREAVGEALKTKEMTQSELSQQLMEILAAVRAIAIPSPYQMDMTGVVIALERLQSTVAGLAAREPYNPKLLLEKHQVAVANVLTDMADKLTAISNQAPVMIKAQKTTTFDEAALVEKIKAVVVELLPPPAASVSPAKVVLPLPRRLLGRKTVDAGFYKRSKLLLRRAP